MKTLTIVLALAALATLPCACTQPGPITAHAPVKTYRNPLLPER